LEFALEFISECGVAMRESTVLLFLLFGLFIFGAAFTAVPA